MSESFPAPQALGTDIVGVPSGAAVELDASLESVSDGIWVSGSVRAQAIGECGRCLDEVRLDVDAAVQGLFAEEPVGSGEDEEEPEDVFEFDGENLDLEDVVRDAVVTALPFTPLCRPDCPGLCDQCGARLADDPDHAHEVIDPRWSALQSLTEQKES
ncbi:YceD family protein [Demequina sp. B12]|uniref:YceD family protein n=1 Tax=Demequina sp. B12 TaxID=2992757 RepID=UPI00237A6D37|nr:YceD family protein [Demequina sp. B12]MDE0572776.1 YceD family protein [Demequina sp. B12]